MLSRWWSRAARSTTARRLAIAVAIGGACAAYTDWIRPQRGVQPSDFAQPRVAATLLLQGENPYDVIGPDGRIFHHFPLIYPLTSAVVAMPFAAWPPPVADALFAGLGAALLAWALTKRALANPQLLVFVSAAMITAAQTVQWSPWLTAATALPALGFVYACKPSVALAYLLAYPSRLALFAAATLTAGTLVVWPWWPGEWLQRLSAATHMSAPVMRLGGPLLLLAALRWRRADARLLLGLAVIPQTPALYEAVPLFLVVRTMEQGVALVLSSWVVYHVMVARMGALDYAAWMDESGLLMLWLLYLPGLYVILRRRNEPDADDPLAWIQRRRASVDPRGGHVE